MSTFRRQIVQLADMALLLLALLLSIWTHQGLAYIFPDIFSQIRHFNLNSWVYFLPILLIWFVVLQYTRIAEYPFLPSRWDSLWRSFRSNVIALMVVMMILYALRLHVVPRSLLVLECLYSTLLIAALTRFGGSLLSHVLIQRHILFLGDAEGAEKTWTTISTPANHHLFDPIGILTDSPLPHSALRTRGTLAQLEERIHQIPVDIVVLQSRGLASEQIQQFMSLCKTEGIEIWLSAEFLTPSLNQMEFMQMDDRPFLTYSPTTRSQWGLMFKRMLDMLGSGLGILILSPLFLVIMIAIRATSPGPIFFSQIRCTLRGRQFPMYKFRTMVQNAESMLSDLAEQNEVSGPVFKIKNDPRITRVGRWLRRYSLDELPQLFNVFKGDMSLVGPRPPIPAEVEKYENWQRRRLSMRAGCTCLWQIGGRNQLTFDEWMRLDLAYIDNWSLLEDFRILFKTFGTVFRGTGC